MGERGVATVSLMLLGGLAVASVLWRTLDVILCLVLGGVLVLVALGFAVRWVVGEMAISYECRRPRHLIQPPPAPKEPQP